MQKIDFVITWVDGTDEKWLEEKRKYKPDENSDNRSARYRDYDTLKYWFRSVEKYASWVNKIYFITWGHLPSWLNTNNPKLVIVNHKDFIPEKYLPTFNSCTIELNMHRIQELSENFVYFNDDMFINNYVKPTDFFKNNLPCDYAILSAIIPSGNDKFEHRIVNNMNFINKYFNVHDVIKSNFFKWFNFKYGLDQVRTLMLLGFNNFSCLKFSHLPVSYNKKNYFNIWEIEPELLDMSCIDKFRSFYGINHWIIQDYQKVTGKFKVRSPKFGHFYVLSNNNEKVYNCIRNKKYKLLCINDSDKVTDFEKVKTELISAFEYNLNEKSSFEK